LVALRQSPPPVHVGSGKRTGGKTAGATWFPELYAEPEPGLTCYDRH
jgi:hypothetical protein